ncbi:hypothetical protein F7Q99_32790 [Streptomyces kaniharaensis]|uniref:DNA-binding protein n=1 Tax=Streptomyces kaniharaensis TaxID=212423 RepID=A0A6N7L2V1_9ACTN|nr:hypothetical protein [Streptomyces kaniharaensis]MQS16838.1 hypothetical protein [Streptomyces kaniharaensis]
MSTTDTSIDELEKLLDAGAVLPAGTVLGAGRPDSAADVLTARAYTHPALGERRVVRLVPGALGSAEDLTLDCLLGLIPDGEPAEVGQVRQEPLGFPAWALVHDPANGHHALALVKEMELLARQVTSMPGAAKDGFDALAERLGRTVPHFLPTYCEEVGRIFLEQGNRTSAARFFGKAREAERTHGLAVDEERLRAVFLEFALAGALTVKAQRQYVKELRSRLDPLTAWQRFRRLCAERSAAGLAPYAGVAEDARALIKAAGLDRAEHEQALLAELLASPAVDQAPGTFWKSWRGAVVELGRRDESVRARLLELLPDPAGVDDQAVQDASWLALLAESGAEELLTGPAVEGNEPAAAWLRRWCNHLGRGRDDHPACAATVALAGRMAGRLRADGVPVDLFTGVRRTPTLLELLDRLLADGAPVADPPERFYLGVDDWAGQARSDSATLAAVAADLRFRPFMRVAAPRAWDDAVRTNAPALPVLREVYAEWADERADELLAARGLAGAAELLRELARHRTTIGDLNPAAAERIAGLDVAGLLARTLRAGILDELGWPALEEALARLGVGESDDVELHGFPKDLVLEDAWPNVIVARTDKAFVVGPQGILLEHTIRIPDRLEQWARTRFRFVDGELLVVWWGQDKQRAYWSSRPAEIFELDGETIAYFGYAYYLAPEAPSLALPGGGRTTGERPLRAGDTWMPDEHRLLADGTGYWTLRDPFGGTDFHEFDPVTGALGRIAEPPRIAATAAAGRLIPAYTRLMPLQPGLENTPLGTDGVVLGSWVRVDDDRTVTTGTADGHTIVLPLHGRSADGYPVGRLALPGAGRPIVTVLGGGELALAHPDMAGTADRTALLPTLKPGGWQAAGTAVVLPLDYWHALTPRDEAGSLVLRAVTEDQAAGLIDAAWPVGDKPVPEDEQRWITVQGVRRKLATSKDARRRLPNHPGIAAALPGIGHPLLLDGVAGLARAAANLLERAARFVPQPDA